jgi:hypothetical protein
MFRAGNGLPFGHAVFAVRTQSHAGENVGTAAHFIENQTQRAREVP